VSGFDASWLALREPYDHAARSAALADRFAKAVGEAPRLLDLGCGTGSNLRYLAPRIAGPQRWLCIDHDPALLEAARTALQDWGNRERGASRDARADGLTLARPGGDILVGLAPGDLARGRVPALDAVTGVTASALLDLTSAAWLDEFAVRCRRTPLLMALSFDGRLAFEPAAPEDDEVSRRFVVHQRTDKGFGPALGPDAAAHLAERLAAAGCTVRLEAADWRLGSADAALLRTTFAGIVAAARAIEHDPVLERWATARGQQLTAGDLRLTVGHLDLLALPR
jgi:SAM-dependent methyltransferase